MKWDGVRKLMWRQNLVSVLLVSQVEEATGERGEGTPQLRSGRGCGRLAAGAFTDLSWLLALSLVIHGTRVDGRENEELVGRSVGVHLEEGRSVSGLSFEKR